MFPRYCFQKVRFAIGTKQQGANQQRHQPTSDSSQHNFRSTMTKRWKIIFFELQTTVWFLINQVKSWFALMMLFSWTFFASAAGACLICSPSPNTALADNLLTLADSLLQSKTVIMARERTNRPNNFFAVEVLVGAIDGIWFNAFIDTTARRKLKQNLDDVVVFRQSYGAPGWLYTAYADTEYQEFIRSILKQSSRWQKFRDDGNRIDFFAERLNHRNQLIREQAYLEVSRAPYASIKRIAGNIPRQQIREFLNNRRFVEFHNLYILMLGQSRHSDDIAYIRSKTEKAAASRSKTNLSAWVAAFIETNPDTGVGEIESLYFSNKNRTIDELLEVIKGLSVLGSEGGFRVAPELVDRRHRIVNSYGTLLDNHPQMAGPVAKDLTIWQIRALVDELTQIRENESALDQYTKMAITYYLLNSKRFPRIETAQ